MLEAVPPAMMIQKLIWTEWLMVVVFVVGVVGWAIRMRRTTRSLEGSFLADRKVPGLIASLSTVATNLNANDFIGGAGFMYAMGVVVAHRRAATDPGILPVRVSGDGGVGGHRRAGGVGRQLAG